MKKRSILTTALAIALVAVIAAGGTLAYLTAEDTEVTNTFTFADGMEVSLWEPEPDAIADEVITGDEESGWNYDNVVVGQTLNKAPTLATTTSVDAYVFVKVSGFSANMTTTITSGWTAVTGTTDNYGNGVFYKAVDGDEDEQELGTIFTEVVIASGATTLDDITIEVYEIQQVGFTSADSAYAETPFAPTAEEG